MSRISKYDKKILLTIIDNIENFMKSYKEEFDFIYKKIGDLEWERATIYLGKKAIMRSDIEMIDEQIENYRENISILIEKVRNEVQRINQQNSRKG